MPATLSALRRKFYRLTDTSADDGGLTTHGESTYEVVDEALLKGLWKAQRYLIDIGAGAQWLTSAALTFGAEDATGARAAEKPADLLRFAGDERYPALHDSSGRPWGTLVRDLRMIRSTTGSGFYWMGNKIWLTPAASPSDTLHIDYYRKLALPATADAEFADFEEAAEDLIPAEAAYHAMHEHWLSGGMEMESKIARNREHWRLEAAQLLRVDNGRQSLGEPETIGGRWMNY